MEVERSSLDLDDLIGDDDEPAIAAITLAELGVGVQITSGKRQRARSEFLEDVERNLLIIDYDSMVARAHAELLASVRRSGRPRGAHDLIIAATALATGRTVVSSDRMGFADIPGLSVRSANRDRPI